jgi:tetratricopeptide (TPR) repeat protein
MTPKLKKSKLVVLITLLTVSGFAVWLSSSKPLSDLDYRQQAEQLAQQQNWEALEKLAKRWFHDHPETGMSHAALGDSMRMRGNFSGAATEYAKALEQDVDNHQIWAYHGIMLLEGGFFAKAATSCEKSVALNPQHAEGWYCLALAHAELGQPDATSAALSRLEPLNPPLLETAQRVIREHTCKKNAVQLGKSIC